MTSIIPAIIPESIEHLTRTLKTIKSFTKSVQIDIVDGKFVNATSWPYREKEKISDLKDIAKNFDVEMDLMIERPEEVLEEYLKQGVSRVVIHLESVENYNKLICLKHEYDYALGLCVNNDTPIEVLLEHIGDADFVQLMGIKTIGAQGNPFDARVLERIALLHKTYPTLTIAIDGSVNKTTLSKLAKAGATKFAVGSAIVGDKDPKKAHARLESLAQ